MPVSTSMSLSSSRFLDLEITNCATCPFHYSQPDTVEMVGGGISHAGSYCFHPSHRDRALVTIKEMEEVGLFSANAYFRHLHEEPFPPDCPLKRKELQGKISGQRNIDLT